MKRLLKTNRNMDVIVSLSNYLHRPSQTLRQAQSDKHLLILILLLLSFGLSAQSVSTNYQSFTRGSASSGGYSTGTFKQHFTVGVWYDSPSMQSQRYSGTSLMPSGFQYVFCDDTLEITAGGVLAFCQGDSVELSVGSGFTSYQWSNGQSTPIIFADSSGDYYAVVNDGNGCLITSDTVGVEAYALPLPNLGNDTAFCETNTLVLDAGNPGGDYVWNTGDTTQSISVSSSGLFSVFITDSNSCEGSDSIDITILPLPTVDLGPDTAYCENDSLQLDAGTGAVVYSWSTGEVGSVITVTQPGTYGVTAIGGNGCLNEDEIIVTENSAPTPSVSSNGNILSTGAFDTYQWYLNDTLIAGANDSVYVATADGQYEVVVTSAGCSGTATINHTLVGIEGFDGLFSLDVYPNPIIDVVNIELILSSHKEVSYELYDITSQLILNKELGLMIGTHKQLVDLSSFSSGMYTLRISVGEQSIFKKVLKN